MPCNSDYMRASNSELSLSRVMCLLDELRSGAHVDPESSAWGGYHPAVYNRSTGKGSMDAQYSALCAALTAMEPAQLMRQSLEMQTWWRDHRIADMKEEAGRRDDAKRNESIQSGLSKLTEAERMALGLK